MVIKIKDFNVVEAALNVVSMLWSNDEYCADVNDAYTVDSVCRLLNAANCAAKVIDEDFYYNKVQLLSAMVDSAEFDMSYDGQVWYIYDTNMVQYSVHDLGQYQEFTGNVPETEDCWWSGIPIQGEAFNLFNNVVYDHLVDFVNNDSVESTMFEYVL